MWLVFRHTRVRDREIKRESEPAKGWTTKKAQAQKLRKDLLWCWVAAEVWDSFAVASGAK